MDLLNTILAATGVWLGYKSYTKTTTTTRDWVNSNNPYASQSKAWHGPSSQDHDGQNLPPGLYRSITNRTVVGQPYGALLSNGKVSN